MPESDRSSGALVVSLDVELTGELAGSPRSTEALQRVLELLAEREIHATWALVGIDRATLDVAELIAKITAHPHQEIGTQTIGCYHSDAPGPSVAELDAELDAAVAIAAQSGAQLRSMVFPRVQCRPEHLPILTRHGIRSYRGRRPGWAHAHSRSSITAALRRGLCLADNFSLLIPDAAVSMARLLAHPRGQPLEIPASRYVRPYEPRFRQLEPLRVHRMQSEMITAAEAGWAYHLWLRPQEFCAHAYESLVAFDNLLRNARALAGRVEFHSLTMDELATSLRRGDPR